MKPLGFESGTPRLHDRRLTDMGDIPGLLRGFLAVFRILMICVDTRYVYHLPGTIIERNRQLAPSLSIHHGASAFRRNPGYLLTPLEDGAASWMAHEGVPGTRGGTIRGTLEGLLR